MWRQGFALLVLGFTVSAHASQSIDFAAENYQWSEYAPDGSTYLTESGLRYSLGLGSTRYDGMGATQTNVRLYFGDVSYDGQLQNGTPYQSITGYTGLNLDQKFLSYVSGSMQGYGEVGYGFDTWRRVLDKGGSNGYTEDYLTLYLRAGLGVGHRDRGWHADLGVKYPLFVNETVDSPPLDPTILAPSPQFSAYAETGFSTRDWGLVLFYDSYEFNPSPQVPITYGGYYTGYVANQPKSITDRLGLRFSAYY